MADCHIIIIMTLRHKGEKMKNKLINKELIERFMSDNNLSKSAFCRLCKISHQTFDKIMGNEESLTLSPVFKIARVMKIHIKDIFYK